MTSALTRTDRLRAGAGEAWTSLFSHPFVREMAAGTLPAARFRFYVEQNIMYLPELSRAMSIGAAKARSVEEMTLFASNALQLLEVEVPTNRRLLERASELAPDERNPEVMTPACAGYTSFLTSVASLHGPTEIMAAILPCAMSYGEIARSLGEVAPHPIYSEWVGFFASDEYAAVVAPLCAALDHMPAPEDEAELQRIFTTASRFERHFWDMGYGSIQWPDLTAAG